MRFSCKHYNFSLSSQSPPSSLNSAVGTGTGKYRNEQLFRARMNHASLIPVMGLVKEADFLGTHSSSSSSSPIAAAGPAHCGSEQPRIKK